MANKTKDLKNTPESHTLEGDRIQKDPVYRDKMPLLDHFPKRTPMFLTPSDVRKLLGDVKLTPGKSITVEVPAGRSEGETFLALKAGKYSITETDRVISISAKFDS